MQINGKNIDRLAACWNACEGIDTEDMDASSVSIIHKLHDDAAKRVLEQRDELLNLLKDVHPYISNNSLRERIGNAIAKTTGISK